MRSFKTSFLLVAATAVMTACGGGGGGTTSVATAPTTLTATASNGATVIAAAEGTPIAFPSGVAPLGTTGTPTTVTISPPQTGTAPTFSVAAGGSTATGTVSFGSCIFTVKTSTFPAGHPLAVGAVLTANPCVITLNTAGEPATSQPHNVGVTLTLGSSTGTGTTTVTITSSGDVFVNDVNVGKVNVAVTTGA